MPFEFVNLQLSGCVLVKPKIYKDERGIFSEVYKHSEFVSNGLDINFMQDNYSFSKYGVLRGIHYQKEPYSQAKLVRCLKGKIYDVAVDLRTDSPTFKRYVIEELSEENGHSLYIPDGFGHGFVVMSAEAVVVYKTGKEYCPEAEGGIFWADDELQIDWGIDFEPQLSEKDKNLPRLKEVFKCVDF